jgi:HD-GYP domain-containing protein (c-di-GMP phosphodiesterase class II)
MPGPRIGVVFGALCALPATLLALVGSRMLMLPMVVHFAVGSLGAAVACAASLALTVAGARLNDARAVLVGTAFSTMTALLAVHALATPGFLVGTNGVIAIAGGLSMPSGAAVLALSALPALRRTRRLGRLVALQVALVLSVLALGALGLARPTLLPEVPAPGSRPAILLLAAGLVCLTLLIVRALRTYALTRRPTDLLVALGCVWLGVAQTGWLLIGGMTVGFWLAHLLELVAVGMLAVPTALDLRRAGASRPLVGDLSATELVASEEAYLGGEVRALMLRLAARDGSTEEHTRRVALLAASVGEELKLSATARRHLAVGGLLHDIGKLAVPLEILQKPGALDDHEFAAIKRHPGDGRRLLEELGGFAEPVRALVSDHHERLDGSGYPRGLTAEEMPIETRILAACDVYDALVSDRVYRSAWSPERAFALLRDESQFDPRVVDALERVTTPGWVVDLAPGRLTSAAWLAAARP